MVLDLMELFFFLDLEKEETASIYIIDPRGRQMVQTSNSFYSRTRLESRSARSLHIVFNEVALKKSVEKTFKKN